MEDASAGAVVLYALFEEQINAESRTLDQFLTSGADSYLEALSYFPDASAFRLRPEEYLEHIRPAKATVGLRIIAALNGVSSGPAGVSTQQRCL